MSQQSKGEIMKYALSCLALVAMTIDASAAALCDQSAAAALKTAAVQQELMVAGLTCHASAAYNRFVLADQPQLQKSDADLMAYFKSRDGNEASYDSYKTKLANLAAGREAGDDAFCAAAARAFRAAEGISLADFVAAQHLMIAAPETCAVKYDRVEEAAVTGPSYDLPATPYGAPAAAPMQRYAGNESQDYDRQNDGRQSYDRRTYNPPRPARGAPDDYAQGWYGPDAWAPPPPPRRWWYQSGYSD
jgi:hypothetical protein